MRTRRTATIQELRQVIDSLPLRTRVAMLEGLQRNEIIVGGYTSKDGGVCPMLAAHRNGGRTNAEDFAKTWDKFGGVKGRRARRATKRELLILRTNLEMSLMADTARVPDLAAALAEHRQLLTQHRHAQHRDRDLERAAHRERARTKRAIEKMRPGDRERTRELRNKPGWAWMRPFRRYDDYERALLRLEAQSSLRPEPPEPLELTAARLGAQAGTGAKSRGPREQPVPPRPAAQPVARARPREQPVSARPVARPVPQPGTQSRPRVEPVPVRPVAQPVARSKSREQQVAPRPVAQPVARSKPRVEPFSARPAAQPVARSRPRDEPVPARSAAPYGVRSKPPDEPVPARPAAKSAARSRPRDEPVPSRPVAKSAARSRPRDEPVPSRPAVKSSRRSKPRDEPTSPRPAAQPGARSKPRDQPVPPRPATQRGAKSKPRDPAAAQREPRPANPTKRARA